MSCHISFVVVVMIVVTLSTHRGQVLTSGHLLLSRILGFGWPEETKYGVSRSWARGLPKWNNQASLLWALYASYSYFLTIWVLTHECPMFSIFVEAFMRHVSNMFLCFVKRDWLNKGDGWKWTLFIVQPRKFIRWEARKGRTSTRPPYQCRNQNWPKLGK